MIRSMTIADYEEVYALWKTITGIGLRSVDDSKEGIEKFLRRNEGLSVVAVLDGRIVGCILSGHDGRRGCLYHVCVHADYRNQGIAGNMVRMALDGLKQEGINKVSIIAFKKNRLGNNFWTGLGWEMREDVNYYDQVLNDMNVTTFVNA